MSFSFFFHVATVPLSLVSIGHDLVTNPGGLLERLANVANWLFSETTSRIERELVAMLDQKSKRAMELVKKQLAKDAADRRRQKVYSTASTLANSVEQRFEELESAQASVQKEVAEAAAVVNATFTNQSEQSLEELKEAQASVQKEITKAAAAVNAIMVSADAWSHILQTQIKSMGHSVDQVHAFCHACFTPMQKHVATLESMSERVAGTLRGAVSVAQGNIGQAVERTTRIARQRLTETIDTLETSLTSLTTLIVAKITDVRNKTANTLTEQKMSSVGQKMTEKAESMVDDASDVVGGTAGEIHSAALRAGATLDEVAYLLAAFSSIGGVGGATSSGSSRSRSADDLEHAKQLCRNLQEGCMTIASVATKTPDMVSVASQKMKADVATLRTRVNELVTGLQAMDIEAAGTGGLEKVRGLTHAVGEKVVGGKLGNASK